MAGFEMREAWALRRATLRSAAWPVAQTAVGAGLAWAIARYGLGHKQPFFAPIAATVSLGASVGRRGRQAVQLMFGVTLGILVADLVVSVIGTGGIQITVVVGLAMLAALVFSHSPLLVNQAGVSAILIVALHQPHAGANRLLDALAGGGVAILFGAVLFPADPWRIVEGAARDVLSALAGGLDRVHEALAHPDRVRPAWSLEIARDVHGSLAALARAQETAASVVKLAPARRRRRGPVERFSAQAKQLDLLANAELTLTRRSLRLIEDGNPAPEWLGHTLETLAAALRELARAPADPVVQESARGLALVAAREIDLHADAEPGVVALATQARAMARDVLLVSGLGAGEAHRRMDAA
jgi:uncharacterized membrane protein YgaE (UPF0421/DUF939 family)